MQLWLLYSLLTAFFESLKDLFSKKGLKHFDEFAAAWAYSFFSLPVLAIFLFTSKPIILEEGFYEILAFAVMINISALVLSMKAIKVSDLSITVPLYSLTPAFLLLTSPIMVGEFPTMLGFVGVLLVVAGSYILNLREIKKGLFQPFKALLSERGPRLMLIVAILASIGSNLDKIGIGLSSPLLWAFSVKVSVALLLSALLIMRRKKRPQINLKSQWPILLPIGICGGLLLAFQMHAISLSLVSYVISVKRLSIVLSVIFGWYFFREAAIKQRLAGAVIMFMGVVFISLYG